MLIAKMPKSVILQVVQRLVRLVEEEQIYAAEDHVLEAWVQSADWPVIAGIKCLTARVYKRGHSLLELLFLLLFTGWFIMKLQVLQKIRILAQSVLGQHLKLDETSDARKDAVD